MDFFSGFPSPSAGTIGAAITADKAGLHSFVPLSLSLGDEQPPATAEPPGVVPPGGRIKLRAALAALRHMEGSVEPAMVFSQLAAVFVPAVCDAVTIDLVEPGGHGYRVRQPAGIARPDPWVAEQRPGAFSPPDRPVIGSHLVSVPIGDGGDGEASVSGAVVCQWRDGYAPNQADAALITVMVDHALALLHQGHQASRHCDGLADHIGNGPGPEAQRVAGAVNVVMAMHRLDQAQAMDLLLTVSRRTSRDLREIADTVLDTGSLPEAGTTDARSG